MQPFEAEIDRLRLDEGFESKPYQDTLGVWTFGIGFTFITQKEAEVVLNMRVKSVYYALCGALPWLSTAPQEVQQVLLNMAYQLGVAGLLEFKKTLELIQRGAYKAASVEMLDSTWNEQTPNRAKRLSKRIRELAVHVVDREI